MSFWYALKSPGGNFIANIEESMLRRLIDAAHYNLRKLPDKTSLENDTIKWILDLKVNQSSLM